MNINSTVASLFRPSHRLSAAVILFMLALAVGLFRPAVSPMPSPPDGAVHSWRGEVRLISTGDSIPANFPDAEITLTGPDELTMTTGVGLQVAYQIKGWPREMNSAAFFHLLRDEKTICLMIQPGQGNMSLADVRLTLPLLRRLPEMGSECTASLSSFRIRENGPTQENNP